MGRYLDIIKRVEETRKPSNEGAMVLTPGCEITWQRANGTMESAIVDFLHTDSDGTRWAFVTMPDGWAAVNLKYARGTDDAL